MGVESRAVIPNEQVKGRHFERAKRVEKSLSPRCKRFLDSTPLRSVPLGMTEEKEWTLAKNETQGEWTLPDKWVWNRGRSFRMSKSTAVIPSERSESRNLLRVGGTRFLDFTPLRSVPLEMTR